MNAAFRATAIFIGPALLVAAAAYFYPTWNHVDEHFQIIEFASWKAGITDVQSLAWEFEAKVRPSLQPWIALAFIRAGMSAGISRFTTLLFIRLAAGLFSLLIVIFAYRQFRSEKNEHSGSVFLLLILGLSTFYLQSTRFSSDFLSGMLLLLGAVLHRKAQNHPQLHYAFLSGAALGTAFAIRYHVLLFILGFVVLDVILSRNVRRFLALAAGGFLILGFSLFADFLFFNAFTCAPCNYFLWNMKNDASQAGIMYAGTSPWYYYLLAGFQALLPVFYVLLIVAFVRCAIARAQIPLMAGLIVFIVLHSAVGHKELRFLFPIIPVSAFFVASAPPPFSGQKRFRILLGLHVAISTIVYTVSCVTFYLGSSWFQVLKFLDGNYKEEHTLIIAADAHQLYTKGHTFPQYFQGKYRISRVKDYCTTLKPQSKQLVVLDKDERQSLDRCAAKTAFSLRKVFQFPVVPEKWEKRIGVTTVYEVD